MKKLLSFAMVLLALTFAACGSGSLENLKAEDIVKKAQTEGANWSVDEWKAASKGMLKNMKPIIDKMMQMKEEADKDPAKAIGMMATMENELKDLADMEKLYSDFETAANATENGKAVMDDEEWAKSVLKELGIPEDALK